MIQLNGINWLFAKVVLVEYISVIRVKRFWLELVGSRERREKWVVIDLPLFANKCLRLEWGQKIVGSGVKFEEY